MTRIAVIGGTGALGAALTRRLAKAGHDIWIGSRDPSRAADFASDFSTEVGGGVCGTGYAEAAASAEVIFLTVPYSAHADTLAQVAVAARNKILVDATVPLMPPKVGTVRLPPIGSAAVEAASILGESVRVVSALQNIGAQKLASSGSIASDVLVAGDDTDAVGVVRELLSEIGLRSWHVGPLANSAAAEALTSVLIQLNRRYKLDQAGIRITAAQSAEGRPGTARRLSVEALPALPLFSAGDDLCSEIGEALDRAAMTLENGDVVVVAQKAVSKVEGRAVALAEVRPSLAATAAANISGKDPAVVELVSSESSELMRVAPGVIISRHRLGHVLANAGIDASNVAVEGDRQVLLWPSDPDASAQQLRAALRERYGVDVAVIVADSLGRAWRLGTTGSAIGVAGMKPLRDRCGELDLFGRELQATVVGVADEIAAAASLVLGEAAEGTPVAIVRGATYDRSDDSGVSSMLRPLDQDLFR